MLSINIISFKQIILMLLIMLLSGSALANVYSLTYGTIALCFFVLLPSILFYIKNNGFKIDYYIIYLSLMLLPPLMLDLFNLKYSISIFTFMIIGYMYSKTTSFFTFKYYYIKSISLLSIVSLVMYFFVNYSNVMIPFLDVVSINTSIHYKIGFLYNYLPYQMNRNCGFFWEPGLYATHLLLAYILLMNYEIRHKRLLKGLFIITILTTRSSAGFALLALVLLIDYFDTKTSIHTETSWGTIIFISLISFFIVAVSFFDKEINMLSYLYFDNMGNLPGILDKLQIDYILSSQRGQAVVFWIDSFISSPVFGKGFSMIDEDYIWDTCTSFMFMGGFGIAGLYYSLCWYKAIFKIKKISKVSKYLLLVLVFSILNKEPHFKILSTWIILFFFLNDDKIT